MLASESHNQALPVGTTFSKKSTYFYTTSRCAWLNYKLHLMHIATVGLRWRVKRELAIRAGLSYYKVVFSSKYTCAMLNPYERCANWSASVPWAMRLHKFVKEMYKSDTRNNALDSRTVASTECTSNLEKKPLYLLWTNCFCFGSV